MFRLTLGTNHSRLTVSAAILSTTVVCYALAQQRSTQSTEEVTAPPQLSEEERNIRFSEQLSGVTLVGHFSISGAREMELAEERYELQGVMHVEGEMWLFQARIRYGDHDVTLPITLPVRWAGDTPVICVDNMGFPGLGTYTARVMIYADHYAGFWTGKDHRGHLFGTIERNRKGKVQEGLPD